ncbi:MFS transporter [Actinoplanes bogorensis]|uniref:MFS transporter n=1 Tax=Paractinoplanes bogorensis TaxID=1610840 RepID=A0ABS5YY69_9ACTN|nr:MFS transporter [Actinoplanes bogorensis]MBU2667624.1 MFS transporter [Actinoplanes bogorensis]
MPLLPTLGRTVGTGVKAARLLVRGSVRGGAWATRRVGTARAKGAANETGMIRLFDLHALSCAGDTLIAIGLAGTIFFNVPLGEARSKVALYLLITMVPFALLAPVVGPLLDHFRHGRRYALAVTMLGRAFLAYVISDHLFNWGLYPAAFGVLALSRAYGVARSAAVPRLLPEGIGLSQVGARASVYGTFAGAVVAPVGLLAFKFGPQWPLRVAMIIFIVGMVVSLRLPPRADSDPPEAVPRPWRTMLRLGRGEDRPLSGPLVIATLIGSASLRLLYGFTLLFLAFVIMADQLDTTVLGNDIGPQGAVGLIGGALAVGTFLSTAVGTRLRIRRPLALQSAGLIVTAAVGVLATLFYSLLMVTLMALVVAVFSGIAKLAVDASIQERVPERLRASAFAHSETVLMIAWVLGGGIGIIPLHGRVGVALATVLAILAAARAAYIATRLHNERLSGRADTPDPAAASSPSASADGNSSDRSSFGSESAPGSGSGSRPGSGSSSGSGSGSGSGDRSGFDPSFGPGDGSRFDRGSGRDHRSGSTAWEPSPDEPSDPWPEAPTVPTRVRPNNTAPGQPTRADRSRSAGSGHPTDRSTPPTRVDHSPTAGDNRSNPSDPPTRVDPGEPKRGWFGRRKDKKTASEPPPPPSPPTAERQRPRTSEPPLSAERPTTPKPDAALAPPGFHVYRPTSADHPTNGSTPTDNQDR